MQRRAISHASILRASLMINTTFTPHQHVRHCAALHSIDYAIMPIRSHERRRHFDSSYKNKTDDFSDDAGRSISTHELRAFAPKVRAAE